MSANTPHFRLGYLARVPHATFLEVTGADPAIELVRIEPDRPPETVIAELATCHGYYVRASRDELPKPFHVTDELLAKLPLLVMAGSQGAGYDPCDPEACTRAGVILVNQAGGNAEAVAEHAVGMMLGLMKRMPETHAAMRAGEAKRRELFMGRNLLGKTVGIIGIGHVGTRVAQILNAAFHCRVLACDPYLDVATVASRGAEKVELTELLAESDVVSIHCPLTSESRNMIEGNAFGAMKPGSILVTTARGSIHDEAAVLAALESGRLAGAGLDVWEKEPPPPESTPLLTHPKVICTQHTAGVTHESRAQITRIAAEAFIACAAGRMPPRILNPEVKPRFAERYRAILGRGISE